MQGIYQPSTRAGIGKVGINPAQPCIPAPDLHKRDEKSSQQAPQQALKDALAGLNARGRRTPCADDPRFTSDNPAELAEAAALCPGCPAFTPCDAAGAAEEHGVWAGIDRTRRRRRRAAS